MFIMLTFSLGLLVLVFLPLISGEADLVVGNSLSQEKILQGASKLCQTQAICNMSNTADKTGCCQACSCDEGCNERNDCCFRDHDRTLQTCEQTSVNTYVLSPFHYYMITMCPPKSRILNLYYRDCGNANVSIWGSLYPVYSPKTGLIYKNHICAECHGITDGLLFDAQVYCPVEWMAYNTLPFECNVRFFFKEDTQHVLKASECGFHCNESMDFFIPPELSAMTKQDIVQACYSGFYSRTKVPLYRFSYKNAFCEICDVPSFFRSDRCGYRDQNGIQQIQFTWLLSPEYISQYTQPARKTYPLACKTAQIQNVSDCLRLHCPYSQLYENGQRCYHPMVEQILNYYKVYLKLLLPKAMDIPRLQGEEDLNKWLRSAWPKRWKIFVVYYQGIDYGERFEGRYLLIQMNMYRQMKHDVIVNEVGKLIAGAWYIQNGNETIKTHGAFNEFEISYSYEIAKYFWIVPFKLDHNSSDSTFNFNNLSLTQVYKKAISADPYSSSNTVISKLYYCPTVVLKAIPLDNLYIRDILIYNNALIFWGQYKKLGYDTNEYIVCHYDSPYKFALLSDGVVLKPLQFQIQTALVTVLNIISILIILLS